MKLNLTPCFFKYFMLISITTCSFGAVKAQSKLQQFDDRVLIHLADHRTPEQTGFFKFISNTNSYVNIAVPAGLFVGGVIGNDKEMRQNSLYVASSTLVSTLAMQLIKSLVKRKRPYTNIRINAVYQPASYSFPSGHSSSSFTTATALSSAYPKWYVIAPAFLWSGSVAYSRMYLGVHYPSDVAAGTALGVGTALSMKFLKAD